MEDKLAWLLALFRKQMSPSGQGFDSSFFLQVERHIVIDCSAKDSSPASGDIGSISSTCTGVSFNGRTAASKTANEGSIPYAPANSFHHSLLTSSHP
jgi:hypothetical protein